MSRQDEFIERVQAVGGMINKIIHLYAALPDDRRDLKQEILSRAWQTYPTFRGEAKFSTWFYRLAVNVAITFVRKVDSRRGLEDRRPEAAADDFQANIPAATNARELMGFVLHQLNPVEKSIVLFLSEGYERSEIAQSLGITENNLRVRIHRLRNKLRSHGVEDHIG